MSLITIVKDGVFNIFKKENIRLVILALLIAVVLWHIVNFGHRSLKIIEVPVYVKMLKNTVISNQVPEKVKIYFTGRKEKINAIQAGSLFVSIDMQDKTAGNYSYNIKELIEVPEGVSIAKIVPQKINIAIENTK